MRNENEINKENEIYKENIKIGFSLKFKINLM